MCLPAKHPKQKLASNETQILLDAVHCVFLPNIFKNKLYGEMLNLFIFKRYCNTKRYTETLLNGYFTLARGRARCCLGSTCVFEFLR